MAQPNKSIWKLMVKMFLKNAHESPPSTKTDQLTAI